MSSHDPEVDAIRTHIEAADPHGLRTAKVLRDTLDQLYDGQRTGRYKFGQLHKTEKTHCGTLVEINMQREFQFSDGRDLDFQIEKIEVDCKYSMSPYGWMIPIEAREKLCLVLHASDEDSTWRMGIFRASEDRLNRGGNRDQKKSVSKEGRNSIVWLFKDEALPENTLLRLDQQSREKILCPSSGQKRINELFHTVQKKIIARTVVETVAQQKDPMKRVRGNGGARSTLRSDGIVILGDCKNHRKIAEALCIPIPDSKSGEFVSVRLAPTTESESNAALIDGTFWKVAAKTDPVCAAPELPKA